MTDAIKTRYDFIVLFDVIDGNPNGDPDAGNLPRMDPQTGHGLVTDVCLKRKVRNYVGLKQHEQPPFEIYIKEKAVLNRQHERAYVALGLTLSGESGKRKGGGGEVEKARQWMCQNFYDVRAFGAVMSTGVNCGQVRGPVQMTFARSMNPITPAEHSITRMAVATEAEAEKQSGDNRTMGRKFTVPYGLYRAHGFISAHLAAQTGFSDADLTLLWEALGNMFEHDHSAARGQMTTRGLYVFQHDSALGNAPSHRLFERVSAALNDPASTPRAFGDYSVSVDEAGLPDGVRLLRLVG
ncbi:MAG: type I-C CRISPR-associated protein Cas7/Csd2 [Candidatus Competibacteraceae bacterium]|nr:type I-C CRISPR-associated protein Cas7/Csd2 [Candidatus Competibacteraceae bacterium]MBK7984568.1 type I-C CRISPR-associated protein Cas7/Csd2 [Candidatus Competibacteraceae bacterium]MBK8897179.1 type I-C CRISPR-associated protein Cas7/Csd2 [Candidatus Competibacteraceae bacterium]MBK8964661.1 type I-C CRISPR-associated protein Cas7/Csd2 [Candidatus Competibacteraceae bacterium]MBK9952660.1 type I-C CRISPR-associated protein Cas7/Csd2 [Candidatus Competibacteraceae bacterium]